MPQTFRELVATGVARDAAKPFLTCYDDATGERVELSYATFDNWVAKIAGFLVDGLDVQPGATVAVALPPHWQRTAVVFGCWLAGAEPAVGPLGQVSSEVAFVAAESFPDLAPHRAGLREVVGLSLRPLGPRLADAPPGVLDFAEEVPVYADRFVPRSAVPLGAATAAQVAAAEALAARLQLTDADRLLVVEPADETAALAAFLVGAGVVLCVNLDPAALPHRSEAERVTRSLPAH